MSGGGSLSREVAIVTGGARGIGLAVVERFVADGAAVVCCDRDADAGRAVTAGAAFVACDVGVEAEVAALVAACEQLAGPPTIVVNNAGVNANFDATTMTEAEWDAFFAVDLKASWLLAKHALPHMHAVGRGAIVNVASIHALATLDGFFPYAAAKSALVGLTRSLALDHGPYGVRVNAVCPGFTRTRLVREGLDMRGVALGRIAEPEEVAAAIRFLAGPDASYVTGTTLVVDGGLLARRPG